jgi:hypothetical protein
MAESPDRRSVARVTVPWHLHGRVLVTRDVRILDLSTAGVRIEHLALLRPGASCSLEFLPPLGPLQLSARVVWSLVRGGEQTLDGERRLHYQSGLAFTGVTVDQQAILAAALEKLTAASGTKDNTLPR